MKFTRPAWDYRIWQPTQSLRTDAVFFYPASLPDCKMVRQYDAAIFWSLLMMLLCGHLHTTKTPFPLCQLLSTTPRTVKLLGVNFQSSFRFGNHVEAILKICSQRIFLLKQLREQGMPLDQLHTVFQAIILSRLTYAITLWGPVKTANWCFVEKIFSLWFI